MVLKPLDAEEFAANQLFGVRRKHRDKPFHESAETAEISDVVLGRRIP